MLIRFEVANFRSILDPVELSMVAVDTGRPEARDTPNLGESLLTVAGVYGPNASGKSNLIAALTWLRKAVADSLRSWDDAIPLVPFAFGGSSRTSDFSIELLVDGVRFEYVLELDQRAVHYEALFHYPERKRRRIFEREGIELKLQRGLGNLSGTRELLTPRTLALSVARRFDEPLVTSFASTLLATQAVLPRTHFVNLAPTVERLDTSRSQALALLQLADLGVDDVEIDDQESHETGRTRGSFPSVRLVHRSLNDRYPLDFQVESDGTRTWFALVGPVLNALQSGSLLLIDELDASLHPALSMQLIRLFHDVATNPAGAQLIFTSHDTSLLTHLNRDEVWLTEKTEEGSTRLGALAEFAGERVRKSQNIERAYLHGRFGALPDVDRTEMLRSLNLIG